MAPLFSTNSHGCCGKQGKKKRLYPVPFIVLIGFCNCDLSLLLCRQQCCMDIHIGLALGAGLIDIDVAVHVITVIQNVVLKTTVDRCKPKHRTWRSILMMTIVTTPHGQLCTTLSHC